jgi:hypothetical protein
MGNTINLNGGIKSLNKVHNEYERIDRSITDYADDIKRQGGLLREDFEDILGFTNEKSFYKWLRRRGMKRSGWWIDPEGKRRGVYDVELLKVALEEEEEATFKKEQIDVAKKILNVFNKKSYTKSYVLTDIVQSWTEDESDQALKALIVKYPERYSQFITKEKDDDKLLKQLVDESGLIGSLKGQLTCRESQLSDQVIMTFKETMRRHDDILHLEKLTTDLVNTSVELSKTQRSVQDLQEITVEQDEIIAGKEDLITQLEEDLSNKEDTIDYLKTEIADKDEEIKYLNEDIIKFITLLDKSSEYLSVRRVCELNGLGKLPTHELGKMGMEMTSQSDDMGIPKYYCTDMQGKWSSVGLYHKDVWAVQYPDLKLPKPIQIVKEGKKNKYLQPKD